MSATLTIAGVDVSAETYYEVSVTVGREDVSGQPDGSVLNATLRDWRGAGDIPDPVTLSARGQILFHGNVTDLSTTYVVDDDRWDTKLTATGPLAALGQARAGFTEYPQETDVQRIIRVLDETGFAHNIDPAWAGPGLIVRPAGDESAGDIARGAADSGQGVLWEDPGDPATPMRYTPQRYRTWSSFKITWAETPQSAWNDPAFAGIRWSQWTTDNIAAEGRPPAVVVNPRAVFADVTFTKTVADYATAHTVTYGVAPEIIERNATVDDPTLRDYTEGVAYELGAVVGFRVPAEITAIRLYHPPGMLATTHAVTLWDGAGSMLATATTVDETDGEWTTVKIGEPVTVTTGSNVTVSYAATDTHLAFSTAPIGSVAPDLCESFGGQIGLPGSYPSTWTGYNYGVDLIWQPVDERPTVTIGAGSPHKDHETELAEQLDAQHYAELRLRQTRTPAWRLDHFEVRLARMADISADALIGFLQIGTRMELILPVSSPVGERWQGFLEGWTHNLIADETGRADHRLLLQVSDRSLTEPGARWADIPPADDWAALDPSMAWEMAIGF